VQRQHQIVDVLGVHISAIDLGQALGQLQSWIETGRRHYVTVTGVHGVIESQRDPSLRDIHNAAGMVTPDGMPMVWACRWAGARRTERVYGPDLLRAVASRSAEEGWTSYFFGGAPGVAEDLAAVLQRDEPRFRVVGICSPPFRSEVVREDDAVIDGMNASGADIVWVGLSTPKQERWMALHRPQLAAPVLIGVGAAFDLVAGRVTQAPRWIQRSGFEWLYRAAREPRRLAGRYLRNNPRFLAGVIRHAPRLVPSGSTPTLDGRWRSLQ